MNKRSFRYKGIADMDQGIALSLTFTAAYYSKELLKMGLGQTDS